MRAIAEHKQQCGTIRCIDQQSQLFECESQSMVYNFRNGTINCNRDVDEPEKESFFSFFFLFYFCSLLSTRKSAIDKVWNWHEQAVRGICASIWNKRKKNGIAGINFAILRLIRFRWRRNLAKENKKKTSQMPFTYTRCPTLAAVHSNSAKDIYTAI